MLLQTAYLHCYSLHIFVVIGNTPYLFMLKNKFIKDIMLINPAKVRIFS